MNANPYEVEWSDEYAPGPDNPHDPSCECADCCASIGYHHPDCQCNACYYGADLAKWAFHPSEY